MRKFFIFLLIIMILICLTGSHYGYKYRNHCTPAIPSISTVNISDDIIEVKYDIEEYKKDKDIYCLKKFQKLVKMINTIMLLKVYGQLLM